MEDSLFREQSVRAKRSLRTGTILLITPVGQTVWTSVIGTVGAALLLWLCLAHYTRREKVAGTLVPQAGLIEFTARSPGQVTGVQVREGQVVRAGDLLLTISGERTSASVGDTNEAVTQLLLSQKAQIASDVAGGDKLAAQQAFAWRQQQQMLSGQLSALDQQMSVGRRQFDSASNLLEKIRPLGTKGYVSAMQIQQQEAQVLDAEAQLKALARQRFEVSQQKSVVDGQLDQLPLTTDAKLNELRRQASQLELTRTQNEADRSTVVRAGQAGTIASVAVKPGHSVAAGQVLVSLLPAGSPLRMELLVPSRAIGFVHADTPVTLHYQAFPYQKFGVGQGTVTEVSRNALTPAEVATVTGQQPPQEAMYRVDVDLTQQAISAYGKMEPLRAGMTVDAELMLDDRRLIEWVMEPLYALQRRSGASP